MWNQTINEGGTIFMNIRDNEDEKTHSKIPENEN